MATLAETFQAFIDQLNASIVSTTTAQELGVLQQQLERVSLSIQNGANIDPEFIAQKLDIDAKAADSDKLDGLDSSSYVQVVDDQ